VEVAAHAIRAPGRFADETVQPPRDETDADGCFLLRGMRSDWVYRLEAAAPGQRIPLRHGPLTSPGAPVTLVLAGLGSLEVVRGGAKLGPISRVSVAASSPSGGSCSAAFRGWPVRFTGLPAGDYRVEAWHEGQRVAVARAVRVPGGTRPGCVRLEPVSRRSVAGIVTDAAGRRLAGMPVAASMQTADGTLLRRTTVTDPDGRFRLAGLSGDAVDLVAGGDGRGRVVTPGVPVGARALTIVFAPSCTVRVTVRTAEGGAPLARAEVGLVTAGLGAMMSRADREGRVVFRVSPGVYALVARARGYRPIGCRIPVRPAGREVTRELRLPRASLHDDAGGQAERPGRGPDPGAGAPIRDGR
jgi:hypothetical protein